MENNNHKKRKVMLIAAFAVAVIALAGVGYAAVASTYKATTVNDTNTANGAYIVVTQDSTVSYTGTFSDNDVAIDTYTDKNYKTNPLFSLSGSTDEAVATIDDKDYYGVQIGETLTLTITESAATPVYATYNIAVKTANGDTLNGTGTDGWTYILKFQGQGSAVYVTNTGNAFNTTTNVVTPKTADSTVDVTLYLASTTLFQGIDNEKPLLWNDSSVKNYDEATAKVNPLDGGVLFENVDIIFEVNGNS